MPPRGGRGGAGLLSHSRSPHTLPPGRAWGLVLALLLVAVVAGLMVLLLLGLVLVSLGGFLFVVVELVWRARFGYLVVLVLGVLFFYRDQASI